MLIQWIKKCCVGLCCVMLALSLTACKSNSGDTTTGTFYTLQEAYDAGLITKNDIMHIVYFINGVVYKTIDDSDEWEVIDFTPQIETPTITELDAKICSDMKEAFYKNEKDGMDRQINYLKEEGLIDETASALDTINIRSFYGKYSNAYAVEMESTLLSYGTGSFITNINDIVWMQFAPVVMIFVYE
jgi:hypothetical protein